MLKLAMACMTGHAVQHLAEAVDLLGTRPFIDRNPYPGVYSKPARWLAHGGISFNDQAGNAFVEEIADIAAGKDAG